MRGGVKKINRAIIFRLLSISIIIFSVFFCWTWGNGYTMGDVFLNSIGLKAWSGASGLHGKHYTVLYSFIMMLVAFVIYATTTKNKLMTFLYFAGGFSALFLIASIVLYIFNF